MLSRLVPQTLLKRAFGDEGDKVVPQTNGSQYKRRKQDSIPKTASDISDSILQWNSPADSDRPSLHPKDGLLLASLNPITAPLSYQVCKHCERPIIGDTNVHLQRCAVYQVSRIQKERDTSSSANTTKVSKRSANTPTSKDTKEVKEIKTKKEKAEKAPPAPRRSKPREAKSKTSTKGKVVDVDKQCGVPLPNGGLCARSLTCKTHAMGAKRAVQGRSAPYDALLADLQRRNQLKLQQKRDGLEEEEESSEPVDPETEVKMVLEAVQRSTPVPLERKVLMPARISNGYFRMREMLAGALINNPVADPTHQRSAAAIGGLIGQATAFYAGDPGQLYHLKPQYETKKK